MKQGDLVRTFLEGYTRAYHHVSSHSNNFFRIPPHSLGLIIESAAYQYKVHFPEGTGWVSDESLIGVE